jgi:hypothetical protein
MKFHLILPVGVSHHSFITAAWEGSSILAYVLDERRRKNESYVGDSQSRSYRVRDVSTFSEGRKYCSIISTFKASLSVLSRPARSSSPSHKATLYILNKGESSFRPGKRRRFLCTDPPPYSSTVALSISRLLYNAHSRVFLFPSKATRADAFHRSAFRTQNTHLTPCR